MAPSLAVGYGSKIVTDLEIPTFYQDPHHVFSRDCSSGLQGYPSSCHPSEILKHPCFKTLQTSHFSFFDVVAQSKSENLNCMHVNIREAVDLWSDVTDATLSLVVHSSVMKSAC